MVHSFEINYNNLLLRQITHDDIEMLRKWRNDRLLTRYLRPIDNITKEMQEEWFNAYLKNNNELSMAIVECAELYTVIGSISLYNFNDVQAEFGKFMIGDKRAHGRGYGRQALVMLLKLGFEEFNLKQIVASVHEDNIAARSNYMRVGCCVIGKTPSLVGGMELNIKIDQSKVKHTNIYYDRIIIKRG